MFERRRRTGNGTPGSLLGSVANEAPSELTDLHMLLLAVFLDGTVISLEDAARVLDLPEAVVRRLAIDLEAKGLIEALRIH